MSEKAPHTVTPEMAEAPTPESLPPRDEAIDAVRSEINTIEDEIGAAEEKVRTPGVTADANEIVQSRGKLRELRATKEPRLSELRSMWTEYGGEDIDRAQAAVDALGVQSDASDHVAAKMALRDAKDTFYARLQESMREPEVTAEEVSPEDPVVSGVEHISEFVRDNPEAAEKAGIISQLADILRQIDEELKRRRPSATSELDAFDDAPTDERLDDSTSDELDDLPPAPTDETLDDASADDVDAGRVHDVEEAHSQAIEEAKDRVTDEEYEQAHADANEEAKDRVTDEEYEQAHAEALEEAEDIRAAEADEREADRLEALNDAEDAKWINRVHRRLSEMFDRARFELGDRFRGNRRSTNVALGVVAIAAGAIVAWKLGAFDRFHDNAQWSSNGGGNGIDAAPKGTGGASGGGIDLGPSDAGPLKPESGVDYSSAAFTVKPGEGWNQTMLDAGIPSDKWSQVLGNETAMRKLESMGLAYRAPELGGWGISRPGTLPKAALDILTEAAKK